jgi:hypothetical protein
MFVELTNNADTRQNDRVYVNINFIIAIYEDREGENSVTRIYGGTGNPVTWTVQESIDEVIKKIEEVLK